MRIIAGEYGGRTLKTVQGPGYRPATSKVRQAVFSMLEARGLEWGKTAVLDCFAGSGSLGLEAVSRGAPLAVFVENNRAAARCIEDNVRTLGIAPGCCRVVAKDLFTVLKQRPDTLAGPEGFGLVCIDPPYGKDLLKPTLESLLQHGWLAPSGFVLAEVEAGLNVDAESHQQLACVVDRNYGQTRILLWQSEK